jgi:hypothetical protein
MVMSSETTTGTKVGEVDGDVIRDGSWDKVGGFVSAS